MKPNWDLLLDRSALAAVLPAEHQSFALPVREALGLFLGGLPPDRQFSILAAQAKLPADASFPRRLSLLAHSSPVLQKLGQILARDRRLPLELRQYLSELESLPPTVSAKVITKALTQELGPLDRLGIRLGPALAEASVAVVAPFQATSVSPAQRKRTGNSVEGVFKLLKPGIEQQLEQELSLLGQVGEFLDDRCEDLGIPHLDYQESFQLARDKLLEEVQLEHEQRHLGWARDFFEDEPRVHIPHLWDYCTPRVTAMERLHGVKVTDHALVSQQERRRLARLIVQTLIAKPILTRREPALFHGDPHAGNLFLTKEGRLGVLDWSLVGTLGTAPREAIVQIMLSSIILDSDRIASVLAELHERGQVDQQSLRIVAEAWTRRIRRGQFPGLSWLVGLLDDAVQTARFRPSAELMLFRKSLLTLEGVVADVGDDQGQVEKTLVVDFLRQFAAEAPLRWLSKPNSRDFATRISNLDVVQTLLCGPTAATRFWTGHTFDILEACVKRSGSVSAIP